MSDFIFGRAHVLDAIKITDDKGTEWLYENYPKHNGRVRKSRTGFISHGGTLYPIKPLGRLASNLADHYMDSNPQTNKFRKHFSILGFHVVYNIEEESKKADKRQKHLAEIWQRPGQAKFRRSVFELFGYACVISRCECLEAIEAAHIIPVHSGGDDKDWNGLPLRADLHRLFDAGFLEIDPETWKVSIKSPASPSYTGLNNIQISHNIRSHDKVNKISEALRKRAGTKNK